MGAPSGKKAILANSLLASLRRIILPFAWVNPSNVNSFLYKGFPFIGHCSIAVMLYHLERTLIWDTELPDDSRALDSNPISFLVLVANSFSIFSLIAFGYGFLLPFLYSLPRQLRSSGAQPQLSKNWLQQSCEWNSVTGLSERVL